MSRISFENYARLAELDHTFTVLAGRYPIQQAAEENIPLDILKKLDLKTEHTLLDIGCGTGNILIPLTAHVKEATGIDHPIVLKRLKQRPDDGSIKCIAGNFLTLEIAGLYDRILIYGVLQNLSDEGEAIRFIDKALEILAPGGKMLIGDIPNQSLKQRFLSSPEGIAFIEQWKKEMEGSPPPDLGLPEDPTTVGFDDDFVAQIIAHVETRIFDCSVLNQSADLPFSHTRQDILIESQE